MRLSWRPLGGYVDSPHQDGTTGQVPRAGPRPDLRKAFRRFEDQASSGTSNTDDTTEPQDQPTEEFKDRNEDDDQPGQGDPHWWPSQPDSSSCPSRAPVLPTPAVDSRGLRGGVQRWTSPNHRPPSTTELARNAMAGLAAGRARGRRCGRRALSAEKVRQLQTLAADRASSVRGICRTLGISRAIDSESARGGTSLTGY
jgi:hypothetical protein